MTPLDGPGRDVCLLAVDNHPTRALVDRDIASDVKLISGGNDETDAAVADTHGQLGLQPVGMVSADGARHR